MTKNGDLCWAFEQNPCLYKALLESNEKYIEFLNQLIKELRVKGVDNIQEKIADAANNLSKFNSTLSELMFACYLAVTENKKVILYPDNCWQGKSPDMESIDIGSDYSVLIEVKLLRDEFTQDESIRPLTCWLEKLSTQNDVAIRPNQGLIDNKESKDRKDLANKTLDCFKSQLAQLDLSKLPKTIQACGSELTIQPSNYGLIGYMGTEYISGWFDMLKSLIKKAACKRSDWKGADLNKPYVVSVDCVGAVSLYLFDFDGFFKESEPEIKNISAIWVRFPDGSMKLFENKYCDDPIRIFPNWLKQPLPKGNMTPVPKTLPEALKLQEEALKSILQSLNDKELIN